MQNSSSVRSDVRKLAVQIESLAREVTAKLDAGTDPIGVANELVRNSSTFVFTLGEMYALEQSGQTGKTVKATAVSNPNKAVVSSSRRFHNVRDSKGRFSRV